MQNSRKYTIQLLKDVAAGKVSAKQAFTPPYAIWLKRGSEYRKAGNDKIYTEAQFNGTSAGHAVNIVLPDNGRKHLIK